MARPGVGAERIIEAIKKLEAEGKEVTVTAVRDELGTGSFSTIGAVLADWRQSKAKEARPAVPEPAESVRGLFNQLWAEAWNAAMRVHEPERQAFARDREEYERGKGEMLAEIARLEAELDATKDDATRRTEALTTERDRLREEVQSLRVTIASVEGALNEARKRADQAEERSRDLSERVIAEAAKAQTLAARLEESKKHKV
jgi:chromosome segregation ATPase